MKCIESAPDVDSTRTLNELTKEFAVIIGHACDASEKETSKSSACVLVETGDR